AEEGFIRPQDVVRPGTAYGGVFAYLMTPYLKKKGFRDDTEALAALPPPLLREGEKTQPDWLYRFLRNPHAIRPVTVLRMPKFNMSDDEAMALVNYFAAADKLDNPSEGLVYPYVAVPQRDDAFWAAKSREYVDKLRQHGQYDERIKELTPVWERQGKEEQAQLDKRVAAAEAALKEAKDDAAKKQAQQALDDLKRQRERVTAKDQQRAWEERYAYAADAHRLLINYNTPCLSCHRAGDVPAKQELGPPLELSWERLRPQWTQKWLANPVRMLSYPTPMPANFLKTDVDAKGHSKVYPEFLGTPLEQATAIRDLLMNFPRTSDMPVNRSHQPRAGGGGSQ